MLRYGKGKNYFFIISLVIYLLFATINLIIPLLEARSIVYITSSKFTTFIKIGIIACSINLLGELLTIIFYRSIRYWVRHCSRNLKLTLLKSVSLIRNSTLNKTSTGALIQRVSNDCDDAYERLWSAADQLKEIIISISAVATIFILNIYFGLIFLFFGIVILIIKRMRNKYQRTARKQNKEIRDNMISSVNEYVRGIRDIKLLGNNHLFLDRTNEKIKEYDDSSYNYKNKVLYYDCAANVIYTIFIVVFCLVGTLFIKNNLLTIASFIIMFQYRYRVHYGFNAFTNISENITEFNIDCDRVQSVLESDLYPKESFGTKHIKKFCGNFEFKNVTFHYDDDPAIIKNMSFKIDNKTTVGIVGKSGAGKTTLFHLLAKLYEVDSGEILLDGFNINDLDKESIRGNITMINQTPYIFNLSILDNLKLANNKATLKDIQEACKMACLDDLIESFPDKYNTIVGENGVTLSGGEKQRLAIARALIQNTEIIFFDEATSALDNQTQEKIQKAIDNMKNKYTVLIIAHRFSTVINCDKILYIEKGVIKGEGTHEELLKSCPGYKKLYELELKKSNE